MASTSRIGAGTVAVLVALSLSACGSSGDDFASKPPKEIVKIVTAEMKSLRSVNLSGSITNAGQQIALDLTADTDSNCTGTMGVAGGTAQLIAVKGVSYLKGDSAFWHGAAGSSGDQIIAVLGSKWAKMPSGSGFSDVCNLSKLFSQMGDVKGTLSTHGTTTLDGKKALEVDSLKSDGTTRVFIALEGKHYILKATKVGGSDPGTLTLSKFDVPVDAKAPAAADVVDLAALGGS